MNSVDMANDLINRARNLKRFEIKRMLDGPIQFNGVVPFTMSINQDCLWAEVYAVTEAEAEAQLDVWLQERL
jgi:hypothetical protein